MLTLEQRQARAFRYLCARPGRIDFTSALGLVKAWWEGPVEGSHVSYAATPLEAIEVVVAKVRADFDARWGMDCEPAAPEASMKEATHGD